jgi:hypothetical protein
MKSYPIYLLGCIHRVLSEVRAHKDVATFMSAAHGLASEYGTPEIRNIMKGDVRLVGILVIRYIRQGNQSV